MLPPFKPKTVGSFRYGGGGGGGKKRTPPAIPRAPGDFSPINFVFRSVGNGILGGPRDAMAAAQRARKAVG